MPTTHSASTRLITLPETGRRKSISHSTSTIWLTVLILPSLPAAMTLPLPTATMRRPSTHSSRARITITIHAGIRPRWISMIMALRFKSLSATGSMNLPKSVTMPSLRAMWPSR